MEEVAANARKSGRIVPTRTDRLPMLLPASESHGGCKKRKEKTTKPLPTSIMFNSKFIKGLDL